MFFMHLELKIFFISHTFVLCESLPYVYTHNRDIHTLILYFSILMQLNGYEL